MEKIRTLTNTKINKLGYGCKYVGLAETTGNKKRLNGSSIYTVTDFAAEESYTGTQGRCISWLNSRIKKDSEIE